MARPKTKAELISLSKSNYGKLLTLVDSFTDNELDVEFPKRYLNRNIKDVLAHLHHWHLLFLNWYRIGMAGEKPDMPEKGYSWQMTPALNKAIWRKYEKEKFGVIRLQLNESFEEVRKIIFRHSEKELFHKKVFRWTGSTSLGVYLVGATSSHYDWAYKLIKKCME